MTTFYKDHWNKVYTNNSVTDLGYYEANPFPSVKLIENCKITKDEIILDVGSGTSTLIPHLVQLGYRNIYALDISEVALEKAKTILGEGYTAVHWLVDDITNPTKIMQKHDVAIWHDRAFFHFLINDDQRQKYLSVMRKIVMPSGYIIMATFSLDAVNMCSGLPVQRYSSKSLSNYFGDSFRLLESMNYTYKMPSGDLRPYIYVRFQKIGK